jgi:DNA repair exonuclease SbcCD ATPase subunit
MKINRIEFRNFASYGNKIQSIDMESEGCLHLITGNNGNGKSTIANIIKFLCYGKVDGFTNSDLPNRINKELWGRIFLEVKGKRVEIERGLAPSVFKVKIDGVDFDQAGKNNVQEYLEEELFGINANVFKNLIILSINDFKSFLTMSPGDKKAIVDKIFGFSVINQMLEIVKREKRELRSSIKSIEDELSAITDSIASTQKKLEVLEKNAKEQNAEKIEELKKKLLELADSKGKLEEAKNTIKKQQGDKENSLKEDRKALISKESNKRKLEKELELFKNDQCPTCHADLKSDFHQGLKEQLQNEKDSNEEDLKTIREKVTGVENEIKEIRAKETKVITKISDLNSKIQGFKSELLELAKKMDKGEHKEFKSLIEEFQQKERNKTTDKTGLTAEEHYVGILENMLGDDGIKNMAMKMILPSLNANISHMTRRLGIPFNISFDNKFDSVITHLGEEVNPKTLSTGERKKADFAIIISLIKMMKVRFPTLNVLFLDEIFSSVDGDGVYHILGILHETIKETKMNAFVINHTVLPSELFDKKIEIAKVSGFSELSTEVIS